jgi:hypothetical protein
MSERLNTPGIIPSYILVVSENSVSLIPVRNLVKEFKANGYNHERVSVVAYELAERRKRLNNPAGGNSDKNWYDAEKLVAIQEMQANRYGQ